VPGYISKWMALSSEKYRYSNSDLDEIPVFWLFPTSPYLFCCA
jgi:hypothetical protein